MNLARLLFFYLLTFSFSFQLRNILVGEWDVFPADSDFKQTSYTIEFHQSSFDPLEQSTLNCTLWKDESMRSYSPSSFIYSEQGPLLASFQIKFNSDFAGSIYNIKNRNFNQHSDIDSHLNTDFSFDLNGNEKISRFKIGKYAFVIDLSEFDKKEHISAEVSSSLDEKDRSLISSQTKYIIARTKEIKNTQHIRQKKSSKDSNANLNKNHHKPIDNIINNINGYLKSMEIDLPNDYIIIAIAILFIFIIFLISKIIVICFSAFKTEKTVKPTTGKKTKKHKKKNSTADNKKEETKSKNETEVPENTDKKDNNENEKVKTD